jgi:hypothetical protein
VSVRAVARPALLVALLVTTMIAAELPPLRALAAWIDAREPSLLRIVAVVLALGFALFFIGILKLVMDRDEALSQSEAEDVARSVRLAARPVFSRSSRYRVIGAAAGRGGADAFRLHEMRAAWRSGAVWREPLWRRRAVTTAGALLIAGGLFSGAVVVGPPWIKVLFALLTIYVAARLAWGWFVSEKINKESLR